MTYYRTSAGGFVFSAGSISFGGSLVIDPVLQQIVRNALNACLYPQFEPVIVSGTLTLPGCVNLAQILTFTFRPTDGSPALTQTTTLGTDGTFFLSDVPAGHYTLHVKGSKWLARNVSVNTIPGDVSGLSLTLVPGDINNDNKVNLMDWGLFVDAFNTDPTSPHWNTNADLNCDDKVNILDLGLLADGFGKRGDP
jgi:hypothetical protein